MKKMTESKRSKSLRFIVINLLILIVLLCATEGFLRLREKSEKQNASPEQPIAERHFLSGVLPDGRKVYYSQTADLRLSKLSDEMENGIPSQAQEFDLEQVEPAVFLQNKPQQCLRIFVVGGSQIWSGVGKKKFKLSVHLRDRIQTRSPESCFEIINAAYHAIDFLGVKNLLQEVSNFSPDLVILHLGGVFPALHLDGMKPADLSKSPTRLAFERVLNKSYLFRHIEQWLHSDDAIDKVWFRSSLNRPDLYNEKSVNHVRNYQNWLDKIFRSMLDDYERAIQQRNTPVLMLGALSNLADVPPFASIHFRALAQKELEMFAEYYRRGKQAAESGDCASALTDLKGADAIDPHYADNAYWLGYCLLKEGEREFAYEALIRARDYDASSERITSMPAGLMQEWSQRVDVPFLDLETYYIDHAPNGIVGNELFRDADHPTVLGLELMAQAIVEWMMTQEFFQASEQSAN